MSVRRNSRALSAQLLCGVAAAAVTAFGASASFAADSGQVEEIVVTGTNIRGAAPVGQNIVQLDRQVIEKTAAVSVQQLLTTAAPQLNGFGAAGQTGGSFEPRLRSLGGSSSASTLVLVDGHRIAPGGGIANTADPNVVPAGAVERIEILPDGASALYGSDAVAGVINIITRKNYNGYEVSGQLGFGKDYSTRQANLVYGHSWDTGSVLATYGYSFASNLYAGDRDFVQGDQTYRGGANFNTFACSPATAVPATGQPGAGLVFTAPYTSAGIANTPTVNGLCSNVRNQDLLPENTAHRIYVSIRQNLGERVKLSANLMYSNSRGVTQDARGTITNVTVFGPGSTPPGGAGQINPFFKGPPGVNRETISFSFDDLLGPGAQTINRNDVILGNASIDVDLGHEWLGSVYVTAAHPKATTEGTGGICQPCALLALNGTAVAAGTPTSNLQGNGLGTVTTEQRIPLTAANALDVWNATGNRTSAEIIRQLTDSKTFNYNARPITDIVGKLDGPLFSLPGGQVKAALGGELYMISNLTQGTAASAIGPTSTSATFNGQRSERTVKSAFAEVIVPIVGEEMGVPLMQKLELDVSGRIDKYSDLAKGNDVTKNPKFGVSWTVMPGLLLRSSYGTSFTAPTVGATALFGTNSTIRDYFGVGSRAFVLPQGYPNSAALGCPAVGSCTISAASGRNGIITFGGNPDLKPQTGRTWSLGFDFRPREVLTGFHANVTYWGAVYRGIITNLTNVDQAASTPGLEDILIAGPTQAQIDKYTFGRTQTTPISLPISFINNITQTNMFNVRGKGVDFDVGYDFDTGFGSFNIGATGEFKFDWKKQTGSGVWLRATNIGNTSNTFSPIKFAGRANVGWRSGPIRADLFANYVSDYYVTDTTPPFAARPCPPNVTTNNLGCQHVASSLIFDTHVAYDFTDGMLDGLQVYVDVRNLLDKNTPWLNSTSTISANGSLNTYGNPIGRVISIGARKRW